MSRAALQMGHRSGASPTTVCPQTAHTCTGLVSQSRPDSTAARACRKSPACPSRPAGTFPRSRTPRPRWRRPGSGRFPLGRSRREPPWPPRPSDRAARGSGRWRGSARPRRWPRTAGRRWAACPLSLAPSRPSTACAPGSRPKKRSAGYPRSWGACRPSLELLSLSSPMTGVSVDCCLRKVCLARHDVAGVQRQSAGRCSRPVRRGGGP